MTHLAEVDPEGAHPSPIGLVVGPVAPWHQMGPASGMFSTAYEDQSKPQVRSVWSYGARHLLQAI
jgi:hypothetical protein